MYSKELDKMKLNPGDVVGIPYYVNLGWKQFRYARIVPKTIQRITPARTKFVMTDGVSYGVHAAFRAITPETEYQNKIIDCAENINSILLDLLMKKRNDDILTKDDDTLVRLSDALDEVKKILSDPGNTSKNKDDVS